MTSSDLLKTLPLKQSHLSKIRSPLPGDKIYKDECVLSFDTPESETGLYVCMNTFLGFGRKHVENYYKKSGNSVFLHFKRIRIEIPKESVPEQSKPTKMAFGVDGGFAGEAAKRYEFEDQHTIVILPEFMTIALPNVDLPEQVQLSVACILASESAWKTEEAKAMSGTWEGEKLNVSKHATNLVQLENGVKIPPQGWKCALCDKIDNLWLNLTDGTILCGRKYFDGTGGNNHALQYFRETSYPLVVKLGTITPTSADVYSYDEDNMVQDPLLEKHLAHYGINIAKMKKTDKSMVELEIDLNQRFGEWAILQESECKLVPMFGPGYTGLENLGNSCYISSVMQMLFSLPPFIKKYYEPNQQIMENFPADPTIDFNTQMSKLAFGLLSGEYSKPPPDKSKSEEWQSEHGLRLQTFKTLVGHAHSEFSTKRQQDAQEYLMHIIELLERNNRNQENPAHCFKFKVEERIECGTSKRVTYNTRNEYMLSLPLPLDSAINKKEVLEYQKLKSEKEILGQKIEPEEIVRPLIPLEECFRLFANDENINGFFSSAINAKTTALKRTKLTSFPEYLILHLKKFTIGDDWVPKKLDVAVQVPDKIDLSWLRGHGLQQGEELLPDLKPATKEFVFDSAILAQLSEMGFSLDGCKRAVYNTQNAGVQEAINWVMEHMCDPDFAEPFNPPNCSTNAEPDFVPNEESIAMIESMGFNRNQAIKALKNTDNNLERAADWIFSHVEELTEDISEPNSMDTAPPDQSIRDGPEKYQLVAFLSHMGTSSMCGHYVCHILRDGHWVIYNDSKVALSEKPPKDHAYLYVYRRAAYL